MREIDALARAADRHANGRVAAGVGDPDDLRRLAELLSEQAAEAAVAASAAAERATAAARAFNGSGAGEARRVSVFVLERLSAFAARLELSLAADVSGFEAPLRQRVDADAARTAELGGELRRLGAEEVELRGAAATAIERLTAFESSSPVPTPSAEMQSPARCRRSRACRRRRSRRARRPPRAPRAPPRAARPGEPARQRGIRDREGAARGAGRSARRSRAEPAELEKLRKELTETVERRFEETFAAVQKHFHEVAGSLFPGGEGRLLLTEPEDEGEEPGIEVELRPAGKRVTRLSLLSGGEKALGAIAFLFSLFLARPSPFYLLDEVEAALDDTNIGRFTTLLRQYADQAQFIVVTHQKRTMEAADVLYGVTMGPDGVSQILSRRLPQDGELAAIA